MSSSMKGYTLNIHSATRDPNESELCEVCGAWRGELGHEPTPEMFVAHLIQVFREMKRILRPDGTLWLNLADSYVGSGGPTISIPDKLSKVQRCNKGSLQCMKHPPVESLKPKDLMGIPWRVALALQRPWRICLTCENEFHENDWGIIRDKRGVRHFICPECVEVRINRISELGWYLRSDIIWHKPNPMPESVTDRPTKSHEYIFLLAKSKHYYYDAEAVRERYTDEIHYRKRMMNLHKENPYHHANRIRDARPIPSGRNRRSVWRITTKGFKGAHFATFPPDVPRLCIQAGTSEKGNCARCGAPWRRILGNPRRIQCGGRGSKTADHVGLSPTSSLRTKQFTVYETIGWEPSCKCKSKITTPVVIDPFVGSGTTLMVAQQLGRDGIGFELNSMYVRSIIPKRLKEA
jgi:DNA modification methylase